MKNRSLFLMAISLVMLNALAARAAEHTISGDTFYGCTNKKDYEDVVRLHAEGDTEAAKQLLAFGMTMGACTIFKEGEPVFTVKAGILTVQIRRKGDPTSYWTAIEAIR